jgi:phospholipid/cholesterol/gamma-HCH transport system substrate-binding protein
MATIKTKFAVGLFVVFGLAMVIVAIVWLGMAQYFEKGQLYAAYFDESVQGLNRDSPVKYRGVSIGRVYSVGVAPDDNHIQVILKIETDIELDSTIVAQLKSVGITGIMFVELEKTAMGMPVPVQQVDFPTKYPVINTKPSDIRQFFDTVTEVLLEFKALDVSGISESLKTTLGKIDQAIEDAQVQQLSQQVDATLEQIQTITDSEKWHAVIQKIDASLSAIHFLAESGKPAVSNLNMAIENANQAVMDSREQVKTLIENLNKSLQAIDNLTQSSDSLILRSNNEILRFMSRLNLALQQYEKAGKNLNRFLERIADQPSQLIFAAPPDTVVIEK